MSKYIYLFLLLFIFSCTNDNEADFFICDDLDDVAWQHTDANSSISVIIENKCLGCHSTGGSAQNFPLTYQMLTVYGNLLADFVNGVAVGFSYQIMPPNGSNPLTDCEKDKILNWINNGFSFNEKNR